MTSLSVLKVLHIPTEQQHNKYDDWEIHIFFKYMHIAREEKNVGLSEIKECEAGNYSVE